MPKKNLFQDMVKIKNENRNKASKKEVVDKIPEIKKENIHIKIKKENPKINYEYSIEDFNKDRNSNKNYFGLWFFVILSLAFLFFTASSFFTKAIVTIDPKVENISLNDTFKATKDLNTNEGFSYQLMILDDVLTNKVPSKGEVDFEEKAKGRIVLYNAFSQSPQTLDINTRLEGIGTNKIYRTDSKVTIPGMSSEGIPGSVEVGIVASEAGESYNSEPLDFDVYGFRNTSKYKKIYGRSITNIEGGFKGKRNVVEEEEKEKVLNETKVALENILLKKALEQIPKGHILFKNGSFFEFEDTIQSLPNQEKNEATLEVKATLHAFLFKEDNFKYNLLKNKSKNQDIDNVYILNPRDLNFSLENDKSNISELREINFKLSGNTYVVSLIDEKSLNERLLGQKKSNFNNVMNRYSNIQKADLVLKPFWVNSIPEAKNKLKIIINYPK